MFGAFLGARRFQSSFLGNTTVTKIAVFPSLSMQNHSERELSPETHKHWRLIRSRFLLSFHARIRRTSLHGSSTGSNPVEDAKPNEVPIANPPDIFAFLVPIR
jgi:hypothetical protein